MWGTTEKHHQRSKMAAELQRSQTRSPRLGGGRVVDACARQKTGGGHDMERQKGER